MNGSVQSARIHDRHHTGSDERRGFCHISELLPELLATIAAPTDSNTEPCPSLPSLTSRITPFADVLADD